MLKIQKFENADQERDFIRKALKEARESNNYSEIDVELIKKEARKRMKK